MSDKKQNYAEAAKLDIMEILTKDVAGIFEFRRISDIAAMMCPLIDAIGNPAEHAQVERTLTSAESKAPNLFRALTSRVFDAQGVVQRKYELVSNLHHDLKVKSLDLQKAAADITVERASLNAHKDALAAYEQKLQLERERLQLEAGIAHKQLVLPALPALPNIDAHAAEVDNDLDDDAEPPKAPEGRPDR